MYLPRFAVGVAASLTAALLLAPGSAVSAADAPAIAPSKEMRGQMATLHEQMAACLRSEKSLSECRTEMMRSCQSLMGSQGCRMATGMGMGMGGGMMGKGQGMHGRMMASPSPSDSGTPK